MRSLVVCSALAVFGCASFPEARLDLTAGLREELKAPVVCGPVGFRKTPLQSRWGEYVRVTVRSPGVLRGSAFVHANGETGETRTWSTEQGELVVEARFENLDPDQRYLLEREQPIDVTLTALEGACEGAVFTVEQGELVPDIEEHAWLAELVRRGGPELAARREAARLAADARRQAHYAAWAARQQREVSAEVLVAQNERRQAHYAQWEAQRNPQPEAWAEYPELVAEASLGSSAGAQTCALHGGSMAACAQAHGRTSVANSTVVIGGGSGLAGGCATCAAAGGSVVAGDAVANSSVIIGGSGVATGCATCAVAGGAVANSTVIVGGESSVAGGCATCAVAGGSLERTGVGGNSTVIIGGGSDVAGAGGSVVTLGGSGVAGGCATCAASGGSVTTSTVIMGGGSGVAGGGGTLSGGVVTGGTVESADVDTGVEVESTSVVVAGGTVASSSVVVGGTVESTNVVGGPVSGCVTCAATGTIAAEWELPEQARLREVAVTTEQHTIATSPTEWAPAPVTATVEVEPDEQVTAVEFVLPALFNFMVQATAPVVVAPAPRPAQRVVRAVPVTP